ncbi:hypothetical protein GFK26_18100 [Variovorax paradoxus]|uniref:PspA/IM30 family protein n=1 Tax=Variovorax paradoxus TaxID=34073 RepID=A0A5Q0M4J4_VARPD|nr:hypothetical protein [Variovorax paradoxus]QFZ84541.1 hypothetical protein GFK26_18100 [Variovorax paradoxus]
MTSTVLKFLRPALQVAGVVKKPAPTTVDGVLGALQRTIVDLDAVREAKCAEADKHGSDAAESLSKSNAATREAARAAAVHEKLSALVA